VPPLALNDALNRSTAAHANYYVLNYGDPRLAGMGLHYETVGRPGFTGISWGERARAAGYTNWAVDENIGLLGNPQRTIDWFIGTINHRWNLLHPSAVHLGYGIATKPAIDVFDIGFGGSRPTVALPTVYPGDGQQNVPASADLRETPDPLPGIPRPVGFPLTIRQSSNWGSSFGYDHQRPNMVGDPSVSDPRSNYEQFINPAAFANSSDFTLGNTPQTITDQRSAPLLNWDVSFDKTTDIGAGQQILLRFEFVNFFGQPNLNGPRSVFGQSNFGAITGVGGFPRIFQFMVKYIF